ncbi:MAG: DUF6438 domain-containing protein [Steroidobacteraceae bacterium]
MPKTNGSLAAIALLVGACTPPSPVTDRITSVTLTRTDCAANCPDYTVHINRAGQVAFIGRKNVTYASAQWKVGERNTQMIMEKVEQADISEADVSKTNRSGCPRFPDVSGFDIIVEAPKGNTQYEMNTCLTVKGQAQMTALAAFIDKLTNTSKAIVATTP